MKTLNIKNIHGSLADQVYIGRPGRGKAGSPLANPFILGKDGDRQTVIKKYRQWLWDQIKYFENNQGKPMSPAICELLRLASVQPNLICFCAPLPCHGDVIISCIKWLLSDQCDSPLKDYVYPQQKAV